MIDAIWEKRVLPTLAEYTRIECLSPAFDPDWAERGAITEAAELLRAWTQEQDRGLLTEIVQLPGRTPVLLVENGGFGASAAAPIARKVMDAYLLRENTPNAAEIVTPEAQADD